jgi:hypothetical protein
MGWLHHTYVASKGGGTMSEKKIQIIILGGGFGGMYCALELEKALKRGLNADVILVNKDNFFLFTPMLHEVAASDLDITNIVNPVRKLLRHVKFLTATSSTSISPRNAWACRPARHTIIMTWSMIICWWHWER